MKGYKGFDKGLICRGKKYAEDTVFEESEAVICEKGMHFCKLPHQVFRYYAPRAGHEFAEVEALDEVHTDDNEKFVTKKLKIGKKISVVELCRRSIPEFFAAFEFDKKIEKAKQTEEQNAGYCGAANAGNYGTANAGDRGAANAGYRGAANAGDYGTANAGDCGAANTGYCGTANAGDFGAANAGDRGAANVGYRGAANAGNRGAANAGYCGAANAGNYGVANAGDYGAANAGNFGAANAGYCGVANVGDCGVANAGNRGAANSGNYGTAIVLGDGVASAGSCGVSIVRENGISSVKPGGAAVAFDGWAKGEIGAALVLIETDKAQGIKEIKAVLVDGEKIKTDTYYRLENGEVIEMEESK